MRAAIIEMLRHCGRHQLQLIYAYVAAVVLGDLEWKDEEADD